MECAQTRRERLHNLIDLALAYRESSKSDLADLLRRDHSRLYPDTDNPKLDLLVGLARALDWSVDAVVDYIAAGQLAPAFSQPASGLELLEQQALEAHARNDFAAMVDAAARMFAVARSGDERGRALRLEGVGWDGQGRFTRALSAFRRGLSQAPLSNGERLALQSNLAHAYYAVWDLSSARGLAHMLVDHFVATAPQTRRERGCQAFAYFVRGHSARRMLSAVPDDARQLAQLARADLARAIELYTSMAADYSADYLLGLANTCRGGLIEIDAELAQRDPTQAVAEIVAAVEGLGQEGEWPAGDWLESYGWWCDFGVNIALRRLSGREMQHSVAVLGEKLLEIARRLKNWALIERAVSIHYSLHQQVVESTGVRLPYTVDSQDLKLIAGVMGRFPQFRRTGWAMLEDVSVIQGTKRS